MAELSAEELTELECAILDACREIKQRGWTIAPGGENAHEKWCCPVMAWHRTRNGLLSFSPLPFSGIGFGLGFDGEPLNGYDNDVEAHAMGRRFRERLELGEL